MSDESNKRIELPMESPTVGRRVFVQATIGAIGCAYAGMIGYPVYRYLASPVEKAAAQAAVSEVTLPDAEQLPSGSALIFKFGAKPALLIHHPDGTWSAMSAVCTHLACTVQYEPEQNRIFCACHGGVYDPKTGANVSGPPPRPLDVFKVTTTANGLTVARG